VAHHRQHAFAGNSVGAVVRWLNDAKIPAPAGGLWVPANLPKLMTNPRLAARRAYRGEIVADGIWPPILDADTFDRIQRLFRQRRNGGRPPTRWLLPGIVRCGECGGYMETSGDKDHMRYRCLPARQGRHRRVGQEKPAAATLPLWRSRSTTSLARWSFNGWPDRLSPTWSLVLGGHARLTAFLLCPDRLPSELEVLVGASPAMPRWGLW